MSYTWKVGALDYAVSQDGLSNVVTNVHWTCSKEDENGNSGYSYGSQGLPAPDPSNFTDWDNLDEYTVITWAVSEMGEEQATAVQDGVDAQIAEKANPTRGTSVPW